MMACGSVRRAVALEPWNGARGRGHQRYCAVLWAWREHRTTLTRRPTTARCLAMVSRPVLTRGTLCATEGADDVLDSNRMGTVSDGPAGDWVG